MLLWIVFAISTCVVVSGAVDYNFRRDFYLNEKQYPEGTWAPVPKEGGRLQLIANTKQNLNLTFPLTVNFGGFSVLIDPSIYPDHLPPNSLDWCHCQYNKNTGSLFTSLHLHTDTDILTITKLFVVDATGFVIVNEPVTITELINEEIQVTYVTTQRNYKELVVHLHNYDRVSHTISSITINNGLVIDTNTVELNNGEHAVRVYDISEGHFGEVSVWTVQLQTDIGSTAYGGRLNKELFPIEDWPKSDQCPFPVSGANEDNFNTLKNDLHVNTHFMGGICSADTTEVFNTAANSSGSWYLLPSEGYMISNPSLVPDTAYAGIAAAFIGDESDSSIAASWSVWQKNLVVQNNFNNRYAIYDGGHSNHLNGVFSGVADIQGMDFYIGACAPHITSWLSDMRIQGSYDYLRTARENHKPLTTWLYSQGWCSSCWSVDNLETGELLVQLASVLIAGGKGLMLFQSDLKLKNEQSWVSGGNFLASVDYLSSFLRVADVEGAKFTTSTDLENKALIEVLADTESLLLVVINTDAYGYNDKTCFATGKHWIFNEQVVDTISVVVPQDLSKLASKRECSSVSQCFIVSEIVNGAEILTLTNVSMSVNNTANTWNINNLSLGDADTVVRMFLLRLQD